MKNILIKAVSFTVAAIMLAGTCFVTVSAQQTVGEPLADKNEVTLLSATDDLGREVSTAKAGDSSKTVGVFYFLWQGAGNKNPESPALDNSKILQKDPTAYESNEKWLAAGGGEYNKTHYWGTPLFDYYRATDSWVVTRDVQMLTDAGVDFICIDYSNGIEYKEALIVLLDTLLKFKAQGFNVPKVTFMTYPKTSAKIVNSLYHNFYTACPEYADLWYKMDGKPLMIGAERPADDMFFDSGVENYFTFRFPQWPRETVHDDGFPWMDFGEKQRMYGKGTSTTVMSVSIAQHSGTLAFSDSAFYGDTTNHTRSWHNGANDTAADAYLYGYNFQEQFDYAISQSPDIIFVTGWNEWTANRQQEFYDLQGNPRSTPVMFIDNADINSSRDMQPMKGGYGDNYYMQLVENIRKYKGNTVNNSNLDASAQKQFATIDTSSVLGQWDNVNAKYLDYTGEIFDRNAEGVGVIYTNTSGRNDISVMKVINDNANLYFYAETVDDIAGTLTDACMSLFIDSGKSNVNKWNGYDLVVGRKAGNDGKLAIERYNGSGWQIVGYADYVISGNKIHLNVPRTILGYNDNNYTVQFKWADNYDMNEGIDSFYIDGDCAPYGRLNYVYSAVSSSAPKAVFADANKDGKLNLMDLLRFKKSIAAQQITGMPDVNGDGEIDIRDLAGLAKFLLGCLKETGTHKVLGNEIPVSGHIITGDWKNSYDGWASAGPQLTYDGSLTTKWNPQVTGFNDTQAPSITYDLGECCSLDEILLTFSSRKYYFKVFVSDDDVVYKQKFVVDSRSANRYYTGLECAIFPENLNARYVKITFWGNPDNTTFIVMNEVKFFGNSVQVTPSGDTRPMNKVPISGYKLVGEFEKSRVGGDFSPELSFDNNNGTYWNPQIKNKDWSTGAGIIYTLDGETDLAKISLRVGSRRYYFDVYTSTDGVNYTLLKKVDFRNAEQYYSGYDCNFEDLDIDGVRYIKVIFTGNSGTTDYGALYEVSVYGKYVPDNRPEVKATITDHEIVGEYTNAQATSGSVGPQKSYDGDLSSKWNPNARFGDTANAGIIYTLDDSYNITKLVLTFSGREYYFDAYVSADGTSWTQVGPSVRSSNYTNVYTGTVATIDGLDTESAGYVKIIFKGVKDNASTYVNLHEVEVYGTAVPDPADPREEVAVHISAHETTGTWTNAGATGQTAERSYDGDTSTGWNAAYSGTASSIVYTLDDTYNLTGATLDFRDRELYFDLYVSSDGTTWTKVASVTSGSGNYTDNVCTISDLNTPDANYIKINFTGNSKATAWFTLYEITLTGKLVPEPREEVAVHISAHETTGTWTNAGASGQTAERSYDGDTSTGWNAAYSGTASSIVYTLDDTYNLTGATLDFRDRELYFDLYVSSDGTTWTKVASVTSGSGNYTDNVCTISDLNTPDANYIKINFTGNSKATAWFTLYEITMMGKKRITDGITVSGVFSSNMVLQRGKPISVWGWGSAGSRVNGTFMGENQSTVTDSDGEWRLTFSAHDANTTGQTMTVSCGDNSVTFTDVLIGDVYIVNGQSNAELAVYRTAAHLDDSGKEEVKERFRHDDGIRIFLQTKSYVVSREDLWATPQEDVINPTWQWQVASQNDNFWNFSALGMYFAKNLRESVAENIPIGLIQTAAGGAFLDELSPNELNEQFGYTTKHAVAPGGYYNTLINPFVGLPISGMLFYQGESNSSYSLADSYARDLSALITEMRERWQQDFPVYNIQLSSHGQQLVDAHTWLALPLVRDAQYQLTNTLSDYYVTVSMDIGYRGETDVSGLQDFAHPKDKKTLGDRVAMQARKVYYGESIGDSGAFSPVPTSVAFSSTGVVITFANAGNGLALAANTGDSLVGFQCVVDGEVIDVSAEIISATQVRLIVDGTRVSQVRYGIFLLAYPEDANLTNDNALPALAFILENPNEVVYTKVFVTGFETTESGYTSLGANGYTPEYSYDGDTSSKWNPLLSSFSAAPGVTYALNTAADIDGITLTFGSRKEYFTLYSSTDGENFTQCAQVTAQNESNYYTNYVCNIDNLGISGARYLKIVFNGSSDNSFWVNFFELELDAEIA